MTNILIIDNLTVHLDRLCKLVEEKIPGSSITIRPTREVSPGDVTAADLIILSGGTGRSIEKNPETYARVVNLVAEAGKPTIGICLGAEAIAVRYGATLKDLPVRRVGNVRLAVHAGAFQVGGKPMAYEFHRWVIKDLDPKLFKVLASSKDGPEVFKHKKLPMYGFQFHPEVRHKDNQGHQFFEAVIGTLQLNREVAAK